MTKRQRAVTTPKATMKTTMATVKATKTTVTTPEATPAAPAPAPAPAPASSLARLTFLIFSQWLEEQDPEKLAAEATLISDTLRRSANIQMFFQRYSAALRARKATR